MEDYEISCSHYAKHIFKEMAEMLRDVRAEHPWMTDEEWKEWVVSQIDWKEI